MAVPVATVVYPADGDIGIPIGDTIDITFDRGIDLQTVKDNVVLYGADNDQTSGPDSALWIDGDTGNNPYFLTSPGFSGIVPCVITVSYVVLATGVAYDGVITSEADELAALVGHKVVITPDEQLAADTEYTLYVNGDPDAIGRGVSSRTVFDVVADPGNASVLGGVLNHGSWEGSGSDQVVIVITTSGDIGDAKYKWYYLSAGAGSAVLGQVTSSRYRILQDGLQIRFSGSGFVAGDEFVFNVEALERMASSFTSVFTTNDGSYTTAPDSPSTPATSTPPGSVLPSAPGAPAVDGTLYVLDMDPLDNSYQVDLNTRTITVTFSEDLDAITITQDTVKLWKYPASGVYGQTQAPVEFAKVLTISNNILTIEF